MSVKDGVYKFTNAELIETIKQKWTHEKKLAVWGVPRGGWNIARILDQLGLATQVEQPHEAEMIVDDVIESGHTRDIHAKLYPEKLFWALIDKTKDRAVWIQFPWETGKHQDIKDHIVHLFELIGENPGREGLKGTPDRVARMYREIFHGYARTMRPEVTVFPNGTDGITYDQIIADEGSFYSQCEHHMVPFFGRYWFGYIPCTTGKVLGLSKVARVVDYFSAKLQVQERLGQEIVNYLSECIGETRGMILILRGQHLCKSMRGVRKEGWMTTAIVQGVFKQESTKQEFMSLINLKG